MPASLSVIVSIRGSPRKGLNERDEIGRGRWLHVPGLRLFAAGGVTMTPLAGQILFTACQADGTVEPTVGALHAEAPHLDSCRGDPAAFALCGWNLGRRVRRASGASRAGRDGRGSRGALRPLSWGVWRSQSALLFKGSRPDTSTIRRCLRLMATPPATRRNLRFMPPFSLLAGARWPGPARGRRGAVRSGWRGCRCRRR